ncbi:hypothetical protein FACS1894178_0070 [Bacteroidia bacterium]|nr:hypothetical protein FACS1894178_0070 [Bacteroidia bacterium]
MPKANLNNTACCRTKPINPILTEFWRKCKNKSVIKLDKNFDIQIHGNRDLIEQGSDSKGKFYKIYYKEET